MSHEPPAWHNYSTGLWVMPGHLFSMHGPGRPGTILKWVVLARRIGPVGRHVPLDTSKFQHSGLHTKSSEFFGKIFLSFQVLEIE